MSDKQTIEVYDQQTEKYLEVANSDGPEYRLKEFERLLKPNSYVLDLGCGSADASAYLVSKGHRVDAVDASAEMVKIAKANYNVDARQATFDEIDGEEVYDGIWASFSLLHASPESFPKHIKALHKALRASGIFHIGLKLRTGEQVIRDRLGRLYTYYCQEELSDILIDNGFMIEEITLGEGVGLAGDIAPWILVQSRKPI